MFHYKHHKHTKQVVSETLYVVTVDILINVCNKNQKMAWL